MKGIFRELFVFGPVLGGPIFIDVLIFTEFHEAAPSLLRFVGLPHL